MSEEPIELFFDSDIEKLMSDNDKLMQEIDALRKQLEIATDGLIKIGDEYDGTRPAKMANKILQDMSLAAIERIRKEG